MNKKGFTLVEVLGVIVIILALGLLVIPNMVNRFSNKKVDIDKVNKQLIIDATKIYIGDNEEVLNDFKTYCLNINELVENDYLNNIKDIIDNKDYVNNYIVKISVGKNNEYDVVKSSECTNRSMYATGNKIKVNDIDFYIISSHDDYVVALKAEPLTVSEVNTYGGVGTENNHVNQYVSSSQGTAYNKNGYGGMQYYSSSTCGYVNGSWVGSGCTTSYNASEIKYVVDGWAQARFTQNQLKTVNEYAARLATKEELQPIGWPSCQSGETNCSKEANTPTWLYNSKYWYWTMSQYNGPSSDVWGVYGDGNLRGLVRNGDGAVRPAINVYKSAIQSIE